MHVCWIVMLELQWFTQSEKYSLTVITYSLTNSHFMVMMIVFINASNTFFQCESIFFDQMHTCFFIWHDGYRRQFVSHEIDWEVDGGDFELGCHSSVLTVHRMQFFVNYMMGSQEIKWCLNIRIYQFMCNTFEFCYWRFAWHFPLGYRYFCFFHNSECRKLKFCLLESKPLYQ